MTRATPTEGIDSLTDLAEMAAFAATFETGSFSAAGERLGLSGQLVGRRVKAIEDRFGVTLIVRSTRAQRPTEAGKLFYEECSRILRDIDRAGDRLLALASSPQGELRIGAPHAFGTMLLMPFATDYLARYADITVTLLLTDRYVDVIAEGYDAVLRIGDLASSNLIARRLRDYRLVPFASPTYLAQRGTPSVPADLSRHECLIYRGASGERLDEWEFHGPDGTQRVRVGGRLAVDDGRATIEAAVAGHGVVLQDAELVAPHVDAGRLVRLLPGHEGRSRRMSLVCPPGLNLEPKLHSFIEAMVARFA